MSKALGWHARSYKVEIMDSKDPLAQLEVSKSSTKDLFKDLLDEIKGFKYQIKVKTSLGSKYIKLPNKLKNSVKGLITIKNNVETFKSIKKNPERIKRTGKNMFSDLDYEGTEFPVSKKDFDKIKKKNNICINVFCYENGLVYPVHISDENFKNCIDLLLITDGNKSHYVYIKDCNRFICSKAKCKSKKHFCKYCLQCFSGKKVLAEHKEIF